MPFERDPGMNASYPFSVTTQWGTMHLVAFPFIISVRGKCKLYIGDDDEYFKSQKEKLEMRHDFAPRVHNSKKTIYTLKTPQSESKSAHL